MRAMGVFTAALVPYGDGRARGYSLSCPCGNISAVHLNTFMVGRDDKQEITALTRKFEAKGWRVNQSAGQIRCPECLRLEHRKKQMAQPVTASTPIPKHPGSNGVDHPSSMSREDRRVIFEKINSVYLNEKNGYQSPWTDGLVAEDMGVARAWVRQVREELFGPEGGNEDIRVALAEAKTVLAEIKSSKASWDILMARSDKIEKRLASFEAALK